MNQIDFLQLLNSSSIQIEGLEIANSVQNDKYLADFHV